MTDRSRSIDTTLHRTQGVLQMTMQRFLQNVGNSLGGFPSSYFVFDVETTGPIPKYDLITQVGHAIVRDGHCVHHAGRKLDWTRVPDLVPAEWLEQRMAATKAVMEAKGKAYHTDWDVMQQEGEDPIQVLEDYFELFEVARKQRFMFLGHNSWNFDRPMFQYHFDRFLRRDFEWGDNEMFDTGMLEKSLQLDMYPYPQDSIRSWAARIGQKRAKGVFWSLDSHCVPKYGLIEKHGLDMDSAHDAGFDCYITHLLFEEYRGIAAQDVTEQPA